MLICLWLILYILCCLFLFCAVYLYCCLFAPFKPVLSLYFVLWCICTFLGLRRFANVPAIVCALFSIYFHLFYYIRHLSITFELSNIYMLFDISV